MSKFISLIMSVLLFFFNMNTPEVKLTGREKISDTENNYASYCADYLEYISNHFLSGSSAKIADKNGLREWIIDTLEDNGYSSSQIKLSNAKAGFANIGKNIILTVPGEDTSKQIIVGAHYDGLGSGDNASGVALVLATATGLADTKLPYTVKYMFFDSEESGLHGSDTYSAAMSNEEVASTIYMINIDCVAFGDYCNIYGGVSHSDGTVTDTEAYDYAMELASSMGYNTYKTDYLDGYYAKNGAGPDLDENGFFTSPWTAANPSPNNGKVYSPSTHEASDFAGFKNRGIQYIYFEATNMYVKGNKLSRNSYTGYYETADTSLGNGGMFMNTGYDTITNLERYFPGRAVSHFNIYSPLLSALLITPM